MHARVALEASWTMNLAISALIYMSAWMWFLTSTRSCWVGISAHIEFRTSKSSSATCTVRSLFWCMNCYIWNASRVCKHAFCKCVMHDPTCRCEVYFLSLILCMKGSIGCLLSSMGPYTVSLCICNSRAYDARSSAISVRWTHELHGPVPTKRTLLCTCLFVNRVPTK